MTDMTLQGYTWSQYHRGTHRGKPRTFVRTDKRAVEFRGVRRVRNVFRQEGRADGPEYVYDGRYFFAV